jgi:hypothetical protein
LDGEISLRFFTRFFDNPFTELLLFSLPEVDSKTFFFASSMPIDFMRSMFFRILALRSASYAVMVPAGASSTGAVVFPNVAFALVSSSIVVGGAMYG